MRWTILLTTLILLFGNMAFAQLDTYSDPGYSSGATGGAPVPTTPSSADSLGLQIPSDVTPSSQSPTAQESTQSLMSTTQEAAYAPGNAEVTSGTYDAVYNKVVIPSGTYSTNNLYVIYAPRTVASCNLYASLPLWMDDSGMGNIWFYEWYPSGALDTQYAGYVYGPGWYKRWFFGDKPGWHVLQYYCGGWSNYAYIYVYGPGGYWVNPNPNPDPVYYQYPYWDGTVIYTYPPTGHTYHSYHSIEWDSSVGELDTLNPGE